eukprot:1161435-Pelagomonas_calceolata.AAC.2
MESGIGTLKEISAHSRQAACIKENLGDLAKVNTRKHANRVKERKGIGYIAVPAYVGSLVEVKTVPGTKPVLAGGKKNM